MALGNKTLARKGFESEVISTEDGELIVDLSDVGDYSYMHAYIELYANSSGNELATPGAGTIEIQASPLGLVFLPLESGGTVNAVDVNTGAYQPPVFDGHADKVKVLFNGVVDAPFARVLLWRND